MKYANKNKDERLMQQLLKTIYDNHL